MKQQTQQTVLILGVTVLTLNYLLTRAPQLISKTKKLCIEFLDNAE